MAANIEIEAKVLITPEEYLKITEFYESDIVKEFEQVNYYIDTKDFSLKQLGIGLRIRLIDNGYVLTLKAPMAEGLLEKDQTISKDDYKKLSKKETFPEGNIKEFVKMIGVNPNSLIILAKLITHRIEIDDTKHSARISIDKNDYNGITDYEIELTGNALKNTKVQLEEICNNLGIVYKDNPKSKQSRAMESIKLK